MKKCNRSAFALPSVLIASVIMLGVLAIAGSSVASVRTALQGQQYEQLAKVAGEAGVAFAKACLAKNDNKPLWTDDKPLTPVTDCEGNVLVDSKVSALIVGGGGGGGEGGGGGGGVIQKSDISVSASTDYSVAVGAGGTGSSNGTVAATNGGNSSVFNLTAIGGGRGGTSGGAPAVGGSGGGARRATVSPVGANGTAGQGNKGGNSLLSTWSGGGGGGGAGAVGQNGGGGASATEYGGSGGNGVISTITGTALYYGGGGGGSVAGTGGQESQRGYGGQGGGGVGYSNQGGTFLAGSGAPNTGGGGGGRSATSGSGTAGNGGSGVVIIKYPNGITASATSGTVETETSGSSTVVKFKSSGTFRVESVASSGCPGDPACSVYYSDNVVSTFSVKKPAVDVDGRATFISQSGIVHLLRKSDGSVWRTYRQPSAQSATVPDVCHSNTTATLGWRDAEEATPPTSVPNAPNALTISSGNPYSVNPHAYFQKDYSVAEAGDYRVRVVAPTQNDKVTVYINDVAVVTAQGSVETAAAVSLSAGCHTIKVDLEHQGVNPSNKKFALALLNAASEPVLVTDTSWRVTSALNPNLTCPTGYIQVPGDYRLNTTDFCVMKYEAKNVSGTPRSQASGFPWVSISQPGAISTIQSTLGSNYSLITENQWMTIVANVLSVDSNWSTGAKGTGYIYNGHVNNNPASALEASINDSDGLYGITGGTGTTSGHNNRRTLTLTNGQVIWDLVGNVAEWTTGIIPNNHPAVSGQTAGQWNQWNNSTLTLNNLPETSSPRSLTATLPSINNWTSSQGIGQLYSDVTTTANRAFLRGGTWGNGSYAGVMCLALNNLPTNAGPAVGFRVTSSGI